MAKKNAIEKSEYINGRYKEFLRSSFHLGNEKLQTLFDEQLIKETLFKGPYVDMILPFQRGKSLKMLIDEGVVSSEFIKLNVNIDRPLYAHQEDSIRRINSGRSAIITTGTGSGKTESFLYPILNELLSDLEKVPKETGIKAIFLYPLNALVNDQIDRLRKTLMDYPQITYGFFTGDTEETLSSKERAKYIQDNGGKVPVNEIISRKEIRDNPPDLLFTNYSMLEYLLIRPNDYKIFEKNRLNNWKFVVLDEAHTYSGALGIELSMLMRRLTGIAQTKPRFILTSATLGEQGKSEADIVSFARKLTSVSFDKEDIIFSKRIPLPEVSEAIEIIGDDILELKNSLDDEKKILDICNKYISVEGSDVRTNLYDLLKGETAVKDIYLTLKNNCADFNRLGGFLTREMTKDQLIALIDLINYAQKDGIGLFELKYHSFVRPLAGAYVTLGSNPQLSLKKTNHIENKKAFEIGNCRFCNSPYIIGRTLFDAESELNYLVQNKEVDIYENYGDNEFVNLDYYLLENSINEDEVEKTTLKEYTLCATCGCVYDSSNKNSLSCSCESAERISIYKVISSKKKEEEARNNISQCPCCGHKSKSGIVKSMNLGKDAGTSVVAQFLYEAIDDGKEKEKSVKKLSLRAPINQVQNKQEKAKQFLAFSDSRQQASFAAVFFDSRHVRSLQKRLIWNVIEENKYQEIKLRQLRSFLEDQIKKNDYFDTKVRDTPLTADQNSWIAVLVDLLKVDGSYDGEGLGLYYFDLDVSDILDNFTDEDIEAELGVYNIKTKKQLCTLMQIVLEVFKTASAINYPEAPLDQDIKKDFLEYRRFDNYVMFQCPKTMDGIRSFLPIKGNDNAVVRYVKKACGCTDEQAKEVLDIVFNSLCVQAGEMDGADPFFIKNNNTSNAYQISVGRYVLKNYKTSKYYQCNTCGNLTPHNLNDCCVKDKCMGKLIEVDPDVALKDNFYRRYYLNKKLERVVVKEHTAQLGREKAKDYQQRFANGKINILSCSTTFEMGIDLGELETVFMRNVPPTPANYVQRAGRAGRAKDSTAYVLTYCGTGSHDYTYFEAPERMINGIIKPPYFDVINEKIITRHLMAASLGYFFRKHKDFYDSFDKLIFEGGEKILYEYIQSYPSDLKDYIDNKILPEPEYQFLHNFNWFTSMNNQDEKLSQLIDMLKVEKAEYESAKLEAMNDENFKQAEYFTKQLSRLKSMCVIDTLSKYCVIPKYGFPVDSVELQIMDGIGKKNDTYDLSRDMKVAISEYAPESEVIVDGKKYTSKYITLPKTNSLKRHYFWECSSCKKVNLANVDKETKKCKCCGDSLTDVITQYFVEPKYGFKTGDTKESSHIKPKRSYAGDVTYIGEGKVEDDKLLLPEIMEVETSSNDKLFVLNKSTFYVCPVCGYGSKGSGNNSVPEIQEEHLNYRQFTCSCLDLKRLKLGHVFHTDVARFRLPSLPYDGNKTALSFLYAFLEGISEALCIERRDIDGVIEYNSENGTYDILIFDAVPGGAGHVKRLVYKNAVLDSLKCALRKVSQECCNEDTSCYNCLRNYYNQSYHNRLIRGKAKVFIQELLDMLVDK